MGKITQVFKRSNREEMKEKTEAIQDGTPLEERDPKALKRANLTLDRQNELFMAWFHKQSVKYVAQTCSVDPATVHRYRKSNDWDNRLRQIQVATHGELDKMLGADLIMQLHEMVVMRRRAYLAAMKGDFENARQAFQSFTDICKLMKELKPGGGDIDGDDLLATLRAGWNLRKAQEGKERIVREIPAVDADAGAEPIKKAANEAATPLLDGATPNSLNRGENAPPCERLGANQEDDFDEHAKQRLSRRK